MTNLASFQDAFSRALLSAADEPDWPFAPVVFQAGFAVYRNTVMKGCIDALQANSPSIERLVGEEWFRAAAAVYVRSNPPRDTRLLELGADFADFLTAFGPASDLPYLPGVARLDRLWTEAHTACDAASLDAAALAGLAPEQLADAVLQPHPAARWAWFEEMPVRSIWQRNRAPQDEASELAWQGEGILFTRPNGAVEWTGLDAAGCAFLDACAAGHAFTRAADAAIEARPQVEIAPLLAGLVAAGAFGTPSEAGHHSSTTRYA